PEGRRTRSETRRGPQHAGLGTDELPGREIPRPPTRPGSGPEGGRTCAAISHRVASAGMGPLPPRRLESQHRGPGEVVRSGEQPERRRRLSMVLPGDGPLAARGEGEGTRVVRPGRREGFG